MSAEKHAQSREYSGMLLITVEPDVLNRNRSWIRRRCFGNVSVFRLRWSVGQISAPGLGPLRPVLDG